MKKWALVILFVYVSAWADDSVSNFAGNAQHTAIFTVTAQDLNAIHWSTPLNPSPTEERAHYGAPVITSTNTILVPVESAGVFGINAFDAADGTAKYTLTSDYILPAHDWEPVYQPALDAVSVPARLYYAGAGGTVYSITNPDTAGHGAPVQTVFYTTLVNYQANAAAFNSTVFINTPITTDQSGNLFFGFRVEGTAPAPLSTNQSGFARIDSTGAGTYVLAGTAASDAQVTSDSHNSAPALSNDESTLYVVVKSAANPKYGFLLGLNSTTLATQYKVFLKDPRNGLGAHIADNSTASPTVAPDGDVYFGIRANPENASRGFLLRFSSDLATEKTPGAFGWDFTPGIVPASMVPSYTGSSSYLVFAKYNNYPRGDGNGVNKIALLDPASTQSDPHLSSGGLTVMREVMTASGPTPDSDKPNAPRAVREWCINMAAINPPTRSIFGTSEDGRLYRWNVGTGVLDQSVVISQGVGEPYVPTVIGPDGTVFTLNGGTLFAVGGVSGIRIRMAAAVAGSATLRSGPPIAFTATVSTTSLGSPAPTGTVTFEDTFYTVVGQDQLAATTASLAVNSPLDGSGQATAQASGLRLGNHFIKAIYSGDSNYAPVSVTLVQAVETSNPAAAISGIKAYPSPWRSDLHSGRPIYFSGLTPTSAIKIFTVSGRWVTTVSESADVVSWDLKNDSGDLVASGLYFYLVTDPLGHQTRGVFSVIR